MSVGRNKSGKGHKEMQFKFQFPFTTVCLLSFLLFCIESGYGETEPKIIGGIVTDITSFQFMLSLRFLTAHVCGASAISATTVVTAAHCLDGGIPTFVINFRTGSSSRTSGGSIINAKQYYLHPQYNRDTLAYDVAVVETAQPLPIKDFAILPPPDYNLLTSSKVDAVGWGDTEDGMLSKELRTVRIPVISPAKCRRAWQQYYTETSLCAGRLNKDSCSGDSGGPLVYQTPNEKLLVGIVSFGSEDCGSSTPGVYTKVSYPAVLEFIKNHTSQ